ncbi:MAG: cytochrome b/b6 [Hyphomonas sp.]|uniref:cytochrome b n=1 Tax=Hyphomonas sp. TaxID=87 RepID=UPI00181E5D7A|nr:cytochrome b N-terminal domain-containing protein [Hyphomonas sp.]MBA3068472.1 cytochrome b/b6 [Hyphomonas sp.]MBU3919269.1 cytochrome b N-terminal domain-containing protein [Alphaproteobacteria bacterium]MBU4060661.1 cytochrome b N-terminal domain-containing protein [Alphaproteobacteria bacterium]MBU4164645.1 cytochrome b N-terminal domain-containing protein [Alphaproteobacteria bacterium]
MSGHESTYTPNSAFERWLDKRLPIIRFANDTAISFPTPKNLNYWYVFGAILAICLVIQIVTGIILAMHYEASVAGAFASVERIMRDVPFGWLLRYVHANGASMFFFAVYIHMFRGLYYGSYKAPREVLWILGCVIFLLMIATAFLGYMLPWGQMSYHGANVITSLFGAIPLVGESLQTWILGGPSIGNQTLQRFFSLHYLLPFMIAGVVVLHIWALHVPGNNNPTGVEVQDVEKDTVPFHPYYTVKDGFAIAVFLILFAYFVFYAPNALGHADQSIEANPLVTPAHIVPEWYMLPFYAILRAITFNLGPIDAKLLGVIFMFAAIAILFVLPWIDTSKVKSMRYRPVARQFFVGFVAVCFLLGWCGAANPDDAVIKSLQGEASLVVSYTADGALATSTYKGGEEAYEAARAFMASLPAAAAPSLEAVLAPTFQFRHLSLILTFMYFGYFILLFFIGLGEKTKPLPESIHKSVLRPHKAKTGNPVPAE